jgi:hypothetical protein
MVTLQKAQCQLCKHDVDLQHHAYFSIQMWKAPRTKVYWHRDCKNPIPPKRSIIPIGELNV